MYWVIFTLLHKQTILPRRPKIGPDTLGFSFRNKGKKNLPSIKFCSLMMGERVIGIKEMKIK